MNTVLNFYNQCIKRSGSQLNNYKKTIFFKGLIKEIDDKLQSIDSKYLFAMEDLHQGTEISCGNVNYLVMTRNEKVNGVYYKYTIQKQPYFINFEAGHILQKIPSIIQTKTIDVQTNQSIILPTGKIIVIISRNNTTDKLAVNDRFIAMGSAWTIVGLDKSLDGIIKVNADKDQIAPGDDIINEIPNNDQKPSYSFNITPNLVNIKKGQTQQLTVVVSENGTTIENPTLIYTSSDKNIVKVDSNGLVTGVNEGSCNIDVTYHGDYDIVNGNVLATVAAEYNYVLSASPETISVNVGETSQITTSVTNYGTIVNNPTINYSSDNNSIASVNSSGLVTASASGSANIIVNYIGLDNKTYSKTIPVAVAQAHNYILSVSPASIRVENGSTQQISASVTDKGIAVSNPTLTYNSDNTAVATVNNTGLVTSISVGSANIIVSYVGEDGNTYTKIIAVTINAVLTKTIAITLGTSDTESPNPNKIKLGHTQSYVISETDSNNNVINDTFTVTGSGCDPSYYTLTIIDGNNFSINNLKGTGSQYLTVTATSKTNPSISGTIKIKLAARW
ncbi:Ig-like domain-containing protein [Clostridium sp. 001]|uniref:Ig-like domain-containing protein n=1 Tax=Clostridium sp. 001 TaxID=1970093 RepID=UPI001C2BD9B1|nr:Ig-like domain-containing protein [Clostridium sp. 001]QXE20057.1 hypothetical protein B5S50_15155 [Clostridium sp. 001]